MTLATTDIPAPAPARRGWLGALGAALEAHATKMSRRASIEALNAASDADLARMGLRREDIARHVFRDLYYT